MNVTITVANAEKISEHIRSLMHHWHPNPQDSDYCCEFCGKNAATNQGEVTHRDDCDGKEMLEVLNAAIALAEG